MEQPRFSRRGYVHLVAARGTLGPLDLTFPEEPNMQDVTHPHHSHEHR